jgi:putative membrane protein
MKRFLVRWLINALAFIVVLLLGLVTADSLWAVLVAALVWGLLNAFLKPLLVLLTLPLNLLTLGLFTLIINAFLLALTSWLVKGFEVGDFKSAILAALIISVVSFLLSWMARERK